MPWPGRKRSMTVQIAEGASGRDAVTVLWVSAMDRSGRSGMGKIRLFC